MGGYKDTIAYAGQMILTGFHGTTLPPEFIGFIRQYKVGNVILFSENITDKEQLHALCREIHEAVVDATGHCAFIAIDQEGGMVSRFPQDVPALPGAMALGRTGSRDNVYQAGRITAAELRMFGINLDLAPSVDINNNRDNPVIGVRSYGETPEDVIRYSSAMVEGLQDGGIISCIKHFPGHGDTNVNSHTSLPVIYRSESELEERELKPFRYHVQNGIDAVMTSHILFPAIDPDYPSTMSERILTGILRNGLGYDGMILTDCMEMKAISDNYGSVNGAMRAIAAGADMITVSHTWELAREILEAIVQKVSPERIQESVTRILKVKNKIAGQITVDRNRNDGAADGIHKGRGSNYSCDGVSNGDAIDTELLTQAGRTFDHLRDCCIDVRSPMNTDDFRRDNTVVIGNAGYQTTLLDGASFRFDFASYVGAELNLPYITTDLRPDGDAIQSICEQLKPYRNIIVGSYNAHLIPEQAAFIKAVDQYCSTTEKRMTVIALRDPYDLDLVGDRCGRIAAYEYSIPMFNAIVRYLRGSGTSGTVNPG